MQEGGLQRIYQSKNKTFLAFCFCFLGSVLFVSVIDYRGSLFPLLFLTFVFFLAIFHIKEPRKRLIMLCIFAIFLGFFRYAFAFPFADTHIAKEIGSTVSFIGYIATEPDIRLDGVRYIVASNDEFTGRVFVKSDLYPRYAYGEEVIVSCQLAAPEPIEDFRYDMYLARFRVFAVCKRPEITQTGEWHGNVFLRYIFSAKDLVAKQIALLWPEPYASFMAGLLYGYRGGLGTLNESFNRTGVTHIVAISGYNITIVASIIIAALSRIGIHRKRRFSLLLFGIATFVIFAGASASVVRAGIMGVIVLFARHGGRGSHTITLLTVTATLMALQNPLTLLWDAGFQLSFLATIGLIYISPLIDKKIGWVPTFLRESFSATLSATAATLPLIMYQFGRVSLVALPVNMLILWILPWIMLLGFLAVCVSFLLPFVASIFVSFSWFGMRYIVWIVEWFSSFSFASLEVSFSLIALCISYAVLFFFLWKRIKKRSAAGA